MLVLSISFKLKIQTLRRASKSKTPSKMVKVAQSKWHLIPLLSSFFLKQMFSLGITTYKNECNRLMIQEQPGHCFCYKWKGIGRPITWKIKVYCCIVLAQTSRLSCILHSIARLCKECLGVILGSSSSWIHMTAWKISPFNKKILF